MPVKTLAHTLTPLERDALAERIAQRRDKLRLPRRQLAERVGCNATSIKFYEQAYQCPSPDRLSALARALETTVEWLMGADDGR